MMVLVFVWLIVSHHLEYQSVDGAHQLLLTGLPGGHAYWVGYWYSHGQLGSFVGAL